MTRSSLWASVHFLSKMRISCLATIVLVTNLLLLVVAGYWAVSSWRLYHSLNHLPHWILRNCTIVSSDVKEEHAAYRNEFIVKNFNISGDPHPIPPTIAYRYGSDIYNQSLDQAEAFSKNFVVGERYPCWYEPLEGSGPRNYSMSMSEPHVGGTVSDRDMAILATVFAVVAICALATQLCCVILTQYEPMYIVPATHAIPGILREGLSSERISELMQLAINAAKAASAHTDKENVCAICLEEEDFLSAKLPCGHLFHSNCIRNWLLRGGATCPLCNMDLSREPSTRRVPTSEVVTPEVSTSEAPATPPVSSAAQLSNSSDPSLECIDCQDTTQEGLPIGLRRRKSSTSTARHDETSSVVDAVGGGAVSRASTANPTWIGPTTTVDMVPFESLYALHVIGRRDPVAPRSSFESPSEERVGTSIATGLTESNALNMVSLMRDLSALHTEGSRRSLTPRPSEEWAPHEGPRES